MPMNKMAGSYKPAPKMGTIRGGGMRVAAANAPAKPPPQKKVSKQVRTNQDAAGIAARKEYTKKLGNI